jgi:GNAT superfamily N-acetyltransferase
MYMAKIEIRKATIEDVSLIRQFIEDLASYERLRAECFATEEALAEHLFGSQPKAEVLIGLLDGKPEGFALFFTTFSTFLCKPGLYLEDLFVVPDARGNGLGKALLVSLAGIASKRGYGRMEWAVLEWNEPAIQFYKKLGAVPMMDWRVYRLTGESLLTAALKAGSID